MLELALAAPMLMLFLTGVIDLSGSISSKFSLQKAADRTLQLVAVQDPATDYTYVRAVAAEYAQIPVANVTHQNWLECDGVRQASFNGFCDPDQESRRFLSVTLRSTYSLHFPFAPDNGDMQIVSTALVRLQ